MLKSIFGKFTKWKILKQLILKDIDTLIIGSLGIVSFISFFVGGVVSIQTALNLENPLLPKDLIGFATRQSVILEFAPTFISIIMAGKVGSYITSSIGTMRVTEQIDALEVMGINTYNYLVFPKIVALSLYPLVICISMFLGVFGGYITQIRWFSSSSEFIQGIQMILFLSHYLCFYQNGFLFFCVGNHPLISRLFYDWRSFFGSRKSQYGLFCLDQCSHHTAQLFNHSNAAYPR